MKKTSRTLRTLMSRASSSQWFDDEDSEDEMNWNETPAERAARVAKKKAEKVMLEIAAMDLHESNIRMCFELVQELFVNEVVTLASLKEQASRARKDTQEFAKAAALKRFSGGIMWNQNQNVSGGPLAVPFKQCISRINQEDLDYERFPAVARAKDGMTLPFSRSHHGGDWIEKVLSTLLPNMANV